MLFADFRRHASHAAYATLPHDAFITPCLSMLPLSMPLRLLFIAAIISPLRRLFSLLSLMPSIRAFHFQTADD